MLEVVNMMIMKMRSKMRLRIMMLEGVEMKLKLG